MGVGGGSGGVKNEIVEVSGGGSSTSSFLLFPLNIFSSFREIKIMTKEVYVGLSGGR